MDTLITHHHPYDHPRVCLQPTNPPEPRSRSTLVDRRREMVHTHSSICDISLSTYIPLLAACFQYLPHSPYTPFQSARQVLWHTAPDALASDHFGEPSWDRATCPDSMADPWVWAGGVGTDSECKVPVVILPTFISTISTTYATLRPLAACAVIS